MEGGTSSALCPYVGGYRGGTMPPDGDSFNEGHIDVVLFLARTCGWCIPVACREENPPSSGGMGSGHQLLSHIQRGVPRRWVRSTRLAAT